MAIKVNYLVFATNTLITSQSHNIKSYSNQLYTITSIYLFEWEFLSKYHWNITDVGDEPPGHEMRGTRLLFFKGFTLWDRQRERERERKTHTQASSEKEREREKHRERHTGLIWERKRERGGGERRVAEEREKRTRRPKQSNSTRPYDTSLEKDAVKKTEWENRCWVAFSSYRLNLFSVYICKVERRQLIYQKSKSRTFLIDVRDWFSSIIHHPGGGIDLWTAGK